MPTTSSGPSLTAPTSTLTLREKLLFSQAVHKLGAGESRWVEVGKLLQECPVIDRPEGYWSEVACAGVYEALMEETGFDKQLKPEQQALPHAEAHLHLAQYFYELRMQELRAEIELKEQKFRTVAAEINAIKSGEAIYNPGIMLRLRDILVAIRSKKSDDLTTTMNRPGVNGVMDVDAGVDAGVDVNKERDEVGRGEEEGEVDVEMKVGEVTEGGKRTGGLAVFKAKDGVVWRMTMEDLRLAAQGNLPLAQKRPLKVVEVTKEDAPIQAQAPPPSTTRRTSPETIDIDMDLATAGSSSQPVSAGPSKRTTPVPSLITSTKSTPRPRQPSSEIREDAPLQPQGPPVRLAKPPLPSPVPVPSSIKETPPIKPAASARPVPRRKRGAKLAVSPDEGTSDVVPDSQERAESEASPAVQVEPPKMTSGTKKRKTRVDDDSEMLVDVKEVEVVPKPEEVDGDEAVDEEVVASSTAGDENRLVLEDEPSRGKRPVVDQSSEDDLTPPPMSPNLPPAQTQSSPRPTTPVKRVHEKQEMEEKQADKPEPSKRRKIQRSVTPVTPVREAPAQPSADELSPVPSTPAHKARGGHAKDTDAEEESESEAEVMVQPKKRGRPRVRVTEEPPKKKAEKAEKAEKSDKADEGDVEAGSRRTRRQEATKRSSARNVKQDMSSPPPVDKRNARASPERSTRTRGNRTRASKDKDEGEDEETDANGEEKAEEPAIVRRSGRRTRAMPDLREEEDEDENEDEAMESAADDAASPAATVDSEKRNKGPSRRNRDKERGSNRGKESPPPKESKQRDAARSRGKESPSPSRDTQRREGRRRAVETEEAEIIEVSPEKDDVEKLEAETPQSVEVLDGDEATQQEEGESPRDEGTKLETPTIRKTRSATTTTTTDTTTRQFKNQMNQLLDEISALKHGNHFKAPVKSSVAPGYYDIIRKPMDLKKIKANIKSGTIRSIEDFERDLWLIFCNAMMFNKPGTDYYIMAEEMMHWCEAKITEFKNAEANATSRS